MVAVPVLVGLQRILLQLKFLESAFSLSLHIELKQIDYLRNIHSALLLFILKHENLIFLFNNRYSEFLEKCLCLKCCFEYLLFSFVSFHLVDFALFTFQCHIIHIIK